MRLLPRSIDQQIQVPAGNSAYLLGQAVGTQNYICQVAQSGYFWKFIGPQATLFVSLPVKNSQILPQITTHFLSPNPAEGGLARATWQGSFDSSAVWAKMIASSTDPAYVAPGAIPWFLLQVVGSAVGPAQPNDVHTPVEHNRWLGAGEWL